MGRYSRSLFAAARQVAAGGVLAYPTEYVYGLGCDPRNQQAVAEVLRLKRRAQYKGFIVIAASVQALREFVELPGGAIGDEILASWPGPTTWILPRKTGVPAWLTGGRNSLAVRVTAHPLARRLCELSGPLLSTSANCSGFPPARTAAAVRCLFRQRLGVVLSGSVQFRGAGTTIRDACSGRTVRAGSVDAGDVSSEKKVTGNIDTMPIIFEN